MEPVNKIHLSFTVLPIYAQQKLFFSGGFRFQYDLKEGDRGNLYTAVSVAHHIMGPDNPTITAFGGGVGYEWGAGFDSDLRLFAELNLTPLLVEESPLRLLPLPNLGLRYDF